MGDIQRASKLLHMTPQTLRLFIREGIFGHAVKGTGTHYIYTVDWEQVRKKVANEYNGDSESDRRVP